MSDVIEVQNEAVSAAFNALAARIGNMSPILTALGDDMVERTKRRFDSATGPDGKRWQSNTQATIVNYIRSSGGKVKLTKDGQIATSKKPLAGPSGDLARQFVSDVSDNALTFGSTMVYAAMQHFGGTKAQFPNLWGDIPARPFMPIMADGTLYPSEEAFIVDWLTQYIQGQ